MQWIKKIFSWIITLFIFLIIIILAILNMHSVTFDYFLGVTQLPLTIIALGMLIIGLVLGGLIVGWGKLFKRHNK